jgi:hypothetical protein
MPSVEVGEKTDHSIEAPMDLLRASVLPGGKKALQV